MAQSAEKAVLATMGQTMQKRGLAQPENPVLLMVSGGSDSTALAYLAADLHQQGLLGSLAMLHVNHQLRGQDADDDAAFVAQLAQLLEIPLFSCSLDIGAMAQSEHGNVEAIARRERYLAANEALESLCLHAGLPLSDGRIFTAHTADDRAESFFMRAIVGTGPGGFRCMKYRNGPVCRPLLDVGRQQLRECLQQREAQGLPLACDAQGMLWREDATNEHTDRFRAYVRHEMVPKAKEWNPQFLEVLTRSLNLIADEDDMLDAQVDQLLADGVTWLVHDEPHQPDFAEGCVLAPNLATVQVPLLRRVVARVLQAMLGQGERIQNASVEAALAAFEGGGINSGYVTNIQGNLAVSANKRGVRIEPMAAFRARRKRA